MLAARRALWPGWRGWSCERRKMKLLAAAALLGLGGGLLMLLFPGTHAEERKKGPKVTVKVSKQGGGGRGGTQAQYSPCIAPPSSTHLLCSGIRRPCSPPSRLQPRCNRLADGQCPEGVSSPALPLLASF